MTEQPPRVFISYAQESDAHARWVLGLAARLRKDGLDAWIDQYEQFPPKGWRPWMTEQIERAHWVLVICTEDYKKRFDGNAPASVGRGVRWESQHITQELYDRKFHNTRFVPVLPPAGDEHCIPIPLKDYQKFRLDDEYEALYRLLTAQPSTPAPVLGKIRHLPPLSVPEVIDAEPPRIPNPYPGLAAFTPEGRRFFFGRDEDTAKAVKRLLQTRLISVVGRSGTGKSSLVAAGVFPALRDRQAAVGYLRFKPEANPFRQFVEALDRILPEERARIGGPRADRLLELLERDPSKIIRDYLPKLNPPILVLADQFEELFTQTPAETAEQFHGFFDCLLETDNFYMALTLRSEFMHRLMGWLGGERFANSLIPLDPISGEDRLRAIICRPAEDSGVTVQPALVSALIQDAHSMAGALPLLAMSLERLFERQGMTLEAYDAMGRLKSVVESAAAAIDEAVEGNPELERACERLFGALATVVDDLPARRAAEVAPLRADPHQSELVEALRAQGFIADPDAAHIELAHETLLTHWPRLRQWCERYSNHLSLRRQAEQAAHDWQKARNRETAEGARSHLLRWGWELQKPALEALLVLNHLLADEAPDFRDAGIAAWRVLEKRLNEPLRSFLDPEPLRLLAELETDATTHQRCEEVGLRLNQMGDLRRGVGLDAGGIPDIAWIDIPAGEVTLETGGLFPVRPFRMARYPVTWGQYRAFLEAEDGYRNRCWWSNPRNKEDEPGELRWAFTNYPAVNVSWYDAVAFCRWMTEKLRLPAEQRVRLPTEWEWQWVAEAGAERREYPWGSEWLTTRANSGESGVGRTVAVGLYPLGAPKPWPVMDLAGNVWEWCLNEQGANTQLTGNANRVLRGGSWLGTPWSCRAAFRDYSTPDHRHDSIGFRVCCGAPIE
ncbi:MAG: SUMF1/EgtB/PvdO family nonheme iron enzyme [Acidobacteria bacterium]|nr:SUMF1/EgtB/PvdO family nonheme iron enzyme [Acidobacteriota bacterium]